MISILTPTKRLQAFAELGEYMLQPGSELQVLMESAQYSNAWFTPEQTSNAIKSIGNMLNKADLKHWPTKLKNHLPKPAALKSVGLVLAGNIPLVGFHDIICVLISGNKALVKLSSQDPKLIPHLLAKLAGFEPGFADMFEFTDRLSQFDAVIATGSNNTSRYFDYYFGKVPHIIRKNRNSVAVLTGSETSTQLGALGHDIFDYYGLGCRNVSKLFVPKGYRFDTFFEGIEHFKSAGDHHKFNNNYDYNKSIYLVNGDKHLDNGFLLLKEDDRMASPLSVLYYEEYSGITDLAKTLNNLADSIQCVVIGNPVNVASQQVPFGGSQNPRLWDYADGIDTMEFLTSL